MKQWSSEPDCRAVGRVNDERTTHEHARTQARRIQNARDLELLFDAKGTIAGVPAPMPSLVVGITVVRHPANKRWLEGVGDSGRVAVPGEDLHRSAHRPRPGKQRPKLLLRRSNLLSWCQQPCLQLKKRAERAVLVLVRAHVDAANRWRNLN